MTHLWQKIIGITLGCIAVVLLFVWYLSLETKPETIQYGMSFNTMYAEELGLDWQETYDALLLEMGVRHLRLAAHWPMIEPEQNVYNFEELDYQVAAAEGVGADVVLAIGRRLPRWPECHVPDWAAKLTWEEQKVEIREYLKIVMDRYKDSSAVVYWQVENEPYLEVFAKEHCGEFDETFFAEEVELVRSIDDSRPLLVTDSGNLGLWAGPYRHGDAFGTSVYVHFWNPELGQFRTVLPPWFYRVKANLMALLYGEQEVILIELSAEPWLLAPIAEVDLDTQFTRMNLEKFEDILTYAEATHMEKQYLWGGEWWYWLKLRGHNEMWDRGLKLYKSSVTIEQ